MREARPPTSCQPPTFTSVRGSIRARRSNTSGINDWNVSNVLFVGDEDDDGQRQCTKILLVLEVLIGGQEYIEVVGGDT